MKKLLITGCSKKKSNIPGRAKDVYQGQIFKKCLELATKKNYDLRILSAKYGILNPNTIIYAYENVIKNKTDVTNLFNLIHDKFEALQSQYQKILVVMGKKYRDVIESWFDERFEIMEGRDYCDYVKKIKERIMEG